MISMFLYIHIYIYNPAMFHLAGTVLNNTWLEQVYLYLFKHYAFKLY